MSSSALLICDASAHHGSGHVMRQITLGESLSRRGVQVVLWCHEIPSGLVTRAESFGIKVVHRSWPQESGQVDALVAPVDPKIVVFDGYGFSPQAIEELGGTGRVVVVVDDNGDHVGVACDVILNQNLHAGAEMYAESSTRPELLLGTRWALIRPEVAAIAHVDSKVRREGVFISVGGLDTRGLATRLRSAVESLREWPVECAGGFAGGVLMTPTEMAERMRSSRVGLIAFGTTTWEALCLGLPVVGLVVADNQLKVGMSIEESGLGRFFDFRTSAETEPVLEALTNLYDDEDSLVRRATLGRELVDGGGSDRVAHRLMELAEF